jgi:hypothetical protein
VTTNTFPSLQSPLVNLQSGIVTTPWYRLFLRLFLQDAPGLIVISGAGSAPQTTLACDGSAVSRTTYADLFSAIGITFGPGDGSTTFNLPNIPDVVAGATYYIHY